MTMIPQPWRGLFRVYGISPVGNRRDKYFTAVGFLTLLFYFVELQINHFHKQSVIKVITAVSSSCLFLSIFSFLVFNYQCPDKYLEFEMELRKMEKELNYLTKDKIKSSSISPAILVWAVTYVLPLPMMMFSFKSKCRSLAMIWMNKLISCVPMLQEVMLVNLVHSRFTALNQVLSGTVVGPGTPAFLDKVFRVHSSLHALAADIDSHYSFYNIFRFITMFVFWVRHMYNVLLFLSGDNDDRVLFYMNQYRVLLLTGFFLLQTLTCHSCSRTANRTVMIVHRLLQPDTDLTIWDQVRMFSAMVTDNKVYFTIGSIFTLDRSLVTKSALAALFYLVVAIQLKDVSVFGSGAGSYNVTTVSMTSSTEYN